METAGTIAIIIVAIFDTVLLIVLIAIAVAILKLLQTVQSTIRTEIPPLFGTVRKTATTVEGTADFVSTTVAMPLIRAVALVFAVSRFFQVLFSRGRSASESRS
jgi:hypothetical protein